MQERWTNENCMLVLLTTANGQLSRQTKNRRQMGNRQTQNRWQMGKWAIVEPTIIGMGDRRIRIVEPAIFEPAIVEPAIVKPEIVEPNPNH